MRHGRARAFVRSFGRSGFASEVRPCLSCCTERAHEMTSNPRIWKQHRLLVPPAAPMDHAPWCGGRVAPSPGTRARESSVMSFVRPDLGQNGPCDFFPRTKPSQKKQAGPADAISLGNSKRFHIGFVVGKKPQGNELSRLPQSRFMSVRGPRTRLAWALIERFYLRPVASPAPH